MKKAVIYIPVIIICFIAGFLIRKSFLTISLSQLDLHNISLVSTTLSGQFREHLLFTLAVGLIPVLHWFASTIAKANSLKHNLVILAIISITGVLFWQMRIFYLNYLFIGLADLVTNGIPSTFSTENLKLTTYLIVGLFFGSGISIIVIRKINEKRLFVGGEIIDVI